MVDAAAFAATTLVGALILLSGSDLRLMLQENDHFGLHEFCEALNPVVVAEDHRFIPLWARPRAPARSAG